MAAKISFMRLTLLSVLCNPSLVSFLILLIKIVYHTKRLKGMKINVDGMKMGHLTKLIAQFYQTTEVMILLKSNDLIQQLEAYHVCFLSHDLSYFSTFSYCKLSKKLFD
jgi:hypothetical protein